MDLDQSKKIRFNMHGYLIEFDENDHSWAWQKWETVYSSTGEAKIVCRKGRLEFMQMFRSLIGDCSDEMSLSKVRTYQQMAKKLKKHGFDYVFLYQGETVEEKRFRTVIEAETFNNLNECTIWNLTDYWFSYNSRLKSWCMFDTFTGELKFYADQKEKSIEQNNITPLFQQNLMLNQSSEIYH